jgi:nitrogen fixation/metabolism regulation signal transduction histidine kinase
MPVVAYLGVLGMLAGTLGERVHARARISSAPRASSIACASTTDTVLRHLTTGVLSVDAAGIVGYLNPAAEQMLGHPCAGIARPRR